MAKTATLSELKAGHGAPSNLPASMPMVSVGLMDSQSFELAQRVAKLFASSTLVPKDYQGNLANCVIALNMASRIGADPLMCMQNLYVVHGRPSWSSQFLIAAINKCGRFNALRYEFKGKEGQDDWGCRAYTIEKDTGETLYGSWITIKMAKDEGWHGKNGSKWKSMPQQMLMYRAASFFQRAYAPEISMGLHTVEEVRESYDLERDEDGAYRVSMDDLRQAEAETARGTEPSTEAAPIDVLPEGSAEADDTAKCPRRGNRVVMIANECAECAHKQGCPALPEEK